MVAAGRNQGGRGLAGCDSMRTWRSLHLTALLSALLVAPPSGAEPLRVHARLGAAKAVSGYQESELSWGMGATLGLELPFTPQVGLAGELGAVYLADGEAPTNPMYRDEDAASAFSGALALHLRPFNTTDLAELGPGAGLWASASGGVTTTGGLQRFMVDAAVGYDFLVGDGSFGVGPALSWLHVFQPDSELRPDDANILLFGIHVLFDGAERRAFDSDGDGIPDSRDRCPMEAEDVDGFEDEDGCPDPDNDADGVLDIVDQCPLEPEDRDGFEDEDGCPDPDNDQDGIPDNLDQCPDEPEDFDGFEDEDGCPDPDNDQDGIPDTEDQCPNEPEVYNGYADKDGCPDLEQVRVVGDKIVLDDRVHFRTNSAIIREVSYPLLYRVAQLIGENPEYIHIEVQGHADRRGDDTFNRDLSQRRAESVMRFLVDKGNLDANRLSFKGFGSSEPLFDRDDEWAWYMNRRVEFKITRQVEKVVRRGGPNDPKPSELGAKDAEAPRGEAIGVDGASAADADAAELDAVDVNAAELDAVDVNAADVEGDEDDEPDASEQAGDKP